MTSRLALLVSLLGTGCSVASLDEFKLADVKNSCSDDTDCVGGRCENGQCRAHQGCVRHAAHRSDGARQFTSDRGRPLPQTLENVPTTGGVQNIDLQ